MKLMIFERKKTKAAYSIERVFEFLYPHFYGKVDFKKINMPFETNNVFKMLANMIFSFIKKRDINHISGDVHYIAALLNTKTTIITIHDCVLLFKKQNAFKLKIQKWLWFTMPIKRAAKIVAISEKTKNEIISFTACNPDKITVIPDSVPYDFKRSEKDFNSQKPVLLHVGTRENKNLENVIKAVKNINCTLRIIGRLSDAQKILLEEFEIVYENRFNISDEDIVKEYSNCDIVIFPSFYEGFGMPILEAQASGKPVITSNISPMKEVADNGAILIDPYNAAEISGAIKKIINDADLRNTIVTLGLENVKNYRPETIAEKYLEIYKELWTKNIKGRG